jgi:hypothetical protein
MGRADRVGLKARSLRAVRVPYSSQRIYDSVRVARMRRSSMKRVGSARACLWPRNYSSVSKKATRSEIS